MFIGSDQNIILGPDGGITSTYNANDPAALRLFLDDQDAAKFDELVSSNTSEEIAIDEKPLPPEVGELRTRKEQEEPLRRYKSADPSVRGEIERIEIEKVIKEVERPE